MNISAALRFPFRGPHAWANIGCMMLCFLIPIVGPLVILGYLIGVERTLIENIHADAPRFDFGKFGVYLNRGIWSFLVRIVIGLIVVPMLWISMALVFVGVFLTQDHPALGIPLIVISAVVYLVLIVLFSIGSMPLILKAGLQESFGAALDFRFLWDYLKRVGLLMVGVYLLFFVVLVPLSVLSMVCCLFVGMYAFMALVMFINAHLQIQIYNEYLRRGGTPIPLKPEPPTPAFPVLPPPTAGNG